MAGLILDKTATLWRLTPSSPAAFGTTQVQAVTCAIVPVSKLDHISPYSYEATHLVYVPHWLELRKGDEIRYGRRPLDDYNDVQPYVYVISGRTAYSQGGAQTIYYATERE
jgi:hypothetical protein